MWVVAGSAIYYHSFTRPPGNPLSVSTTNPIIFLPEMTLSTQFVAVIHVHLGTLFGDQNIAIVFVVAGETGQCIVFVPVEEVDVSVGCFRSNSNGDNLLVVTLATLESLNFVLSGFDPKKPTLVFYPS